MRDDRDRGGQSRVYGHDGEGDQETKSRFKARQVFFS